MLAELGLKNLDRFSDYEPEFCTHSYVMSKLMSLPVLPCARCIRWIFPRMLDRLDLAIFLNPVWMTQSVGPNFSFIRTYLVVR